MNTNALRFDLYKGPFTRNDEYSVSFYPDRFEYIPNISLSVAKKVLPALNGKGNAKRDMTEREISLRGFSIDEFDVDLLDDMGMSEMGLIRRVDQDLTLGHITNDVRHFPLSLTNLLLTCPVVDLFRGPR